MHGSIEFRVRFFSTMKLSAERVFISTKESINDHSIMHFSYLSLNLPMWVCSFDFSLILKLFFINFLLLDSLDCLPFYDKLVMIEVTEPFIRIG